MSALPRIGIVGTGRMGAGIAKRLHDVGYPICALYDIDPETARATAAETGGEVTTSLARVTALSDTIVTVVTDDAAMRAIFASDGDTLLANAKGRIFINTATLTPSVHVEIEKLAESRGAQSLEACMASSIPQARNGTLYLMVAGRRETFERVKPLLEKMSSSLRYIGESGRAAQLKALVNMVMNINTAGLAEGLGLADALGLDLDVVRDVFAQTGANSRVLETDGADMQQRDHDVYFSAEHAAKDSGIALALARDADLDLPLAQATLRQFERMKALGLGNLDKSGVSELTFAQRHGRDPAFKPITHIITGGNNMSTGTSQRLVPAVSSATAGPLGAIHLPRLWLKLTLASTGTLAEGYDECGAGFDAMTLSALGLDREKTMQFVRTQHPNYVQFEEYVVANGKTDRATIDAHNAAIRGYNHGEELATRMRSELGLKNAAIADAVTLNTLEDLDEIHRRTRAR